MNPIALRLQVSLFSACRHAPGFIRSQFHGMCKKDQQKARNCIEIFDAVLASGTVFCDELVDNLTVKLELLEALRDSVAFAKRAENQELEKMLKGVHCFATVTSLMMHLNDCIAEGDEQAQHLANECNEFVAKISVSAPNLNQLGAKTTHLMIDFFEKRKYDLYSVEIADHMLTAYSTR